MSESRQSANGQAAASSGGLLTASNLDTSVLIAVRVCLLGIGLIAATVYSAAYGGDYSQIKSLYPKIALLFGFCALSGLWIIWRQTGVLFTYVQFLADIIVITGLIYLTGGPISPLLFLYLPLIMGAAILSSRRTALILGAGSLVTYTLLVLLMVGGWITPADGDTVVQMPTRGIFLQVVGLGSAMVLIAVATGYLRSTIRGSLLLAEQSTKDLEALTARQRVLVEGIQDGLATTNLDGMVTTINQAALELLGLTTEEATGHHLGELLGTAFPQGEFATQNGANGKPVELEVYHRDSKEPIKVIYTARPITDDEDKQTGTVYIFQDVTKLRSIEEQLELQERMAKLLSEKREPIGFSHPKLNDFVGESPVMRKVFQLIERVASSEANVLVTGESGTGKELVARAIHASGDRANGPFVAINCGAVPESLIESQLFGHKKGSFTSADSDHMGLFEQARGGTLFLDEIGELPLQMQSKLLRAIQEKSIRRIGGDREISIDVRIVSATNRNLKKEVEENRFREDLFYRLNVISISLPALRERKEDIPLLVNSILKRYVDENTTPVVTPATMQLLLGYHYPGNVRELENVLERALVLGGEVILPDHLPENVLDARKAASSSVPGETQIIIDESLDLPIKLDELLSTIERKYLETALVQTNGAKKKAANLLGINFRSFRYRCQKFGIGE